MTGWNATTLGPRAATVGPRCALLVERLLRQRRHPQQSFRSCLGVRSLVHKYDITRLEAAAARERKQTVLSWKSLRAVLKNGLDMETPEPQPGLDPPEDEHLCGAAYYQSNQLP